MEHVLHRNALYRVSLLRTPYTYTHNYIHIQVTITVINMQQLVETSGYATWFTAGGAIRIAHYDVIDDVITRKL